MSEQAGGIDAARHAWNYFEQKPRGTRRAREAIHAHRKAFCLEFVVDKLSVGSVELVVTVGTFVMACMARLRRS